ncbi:MAG: carbohydrate binding domain-containing protein [Caldilineaceae bacterium]
MNDLLKKRIHSIFFMISSSLLLLFFSTILSPAEMAVANPSASASNSIDANGASSSANLVKNGDFSDGDTHWFVTGETDTSGGALCATIPGGTVSPWDAQISQGEIQLESKHFYKLTFDMLASTDGAVVNAIIGQDQYPWAQYYATSLSLRSILQHYQFIMQAPAEAGASGFFLHIGGTTAERFCLDNVSLTDIGQSSGPTPTPIPNPPPVIFDDFSYNSSDLNTISANGIHSIFGVNPWMTETGEIDSRFWRRYNWDELYMGPNVTVSASAEGMKLTALAGLDVDKDPDPAIFSGVAFPNRGAGTYHALIRFDDLASDIRTIQAFWNFALNQYAFVDESGATYLPRGEPSYIASETDIEWNNWFTGDSIAGFPPQIISVRTMI